MKLSLLVASLFLAVSPALADSVTISDVNPAWELVTLTPSTVIDQASPFPGLVLFQTTLPANWTRGEAFTFSLSFNGSSISGSGNASMGFFTQFGFYFPMLTQEYTAAVTVSFANGGTATEQFILAPVPEPATWAFLVTGLLGLAAQARWAKQKGPALGETVLHRKSTH